MYLCILRWGVYGWVTEMVRVEPWTTLILLPLFRSYHDKICQKENPDQSLGLQHPLLCLKAPIFKNSLSKVSKHIHTLSVRGSMHLSTTLESNSPPFFNGSVSKTPDATFRI